MKRKVLCIILSIILSTLALTTGVAAAAEYRVAYVARAQADSFAAWLANSLRAEAEKYDDITLTVFDSQANEERGNTLIENAITNKFDAIIVQAHNGEAQKPYIAKIVEAGIVCITTNPRVEVPGASTVDADPYEQAAVNARVAVNQIPQDAKVVVLTGPPGNMHSTERRKAWQAEFFDKRPDVQIVAEDIANWNKDEAMALMEDWVIAHGVVQGIISMNDNMCAGALEVLVGKPEFDGIFSYGVDGTAEALLLIRDGRMTSTGLQSAIDIAELNLDIVNKLLTGEGTEFHVDVPAPLINKDNVQELIDVYISRGLIE